MKLHIANKNYSSWSLRPWVLMRTLGIGFEEVLHPFPIGGGSTGFQAFSPTGKVPCLVDGDLTVWDSLAIAEYLAEQHAGVWPQVQTARAWARSAAAEMHSGFQTLRQVCSMSCGVRVDLRPEALQMLAPDLERLQTLWREGLQRFGRSLPGRRRVQRGRCVFLPGGLSRANLWSVARRHLHRLCANPA